MFFSGKQNAKVFSFAFIFLPLRRGAAVWEKGIPKKTQEQKFSFLLLCVKQVYREMPLFSGRAETSFAAFRLR